MRDEVRGLAAALAFLSRIPVPRSLVLGSNDVARASAYFPLVGAGLGAATGLAAWGLAHEVPALLAAALAVALLALLTGALHFDALADTADAAGGATRERALEIVRDHAVGSYGTLALVLDVVIRVAAVGALAGSWHVVAYLAASGAVARACSVAVGSALPYARASGGLGAPFAQGSRVRAAVACLLALGIAVAVAGLTGLVIAAVGAVVAVLCAVVGAAWLGGVTGDTLGATVELVELAGIVAAAAA